MKTTSHKQTHLGMFVSFLAALFIVLNGRWDLIGKAIVSPLFYVALTVSFAIAFFLLSVVHHGNRMLDKYHPWNKNFYLRLLLQVLVGVLLPAILDIVLVAVFLKAKHSEIDMLSYLIHDFPIVLLLLILANVYYAVNLFLQKPGHNGVPDMDNINPPYAIRIQNDNRNIKLNIREDVLYCCRMGRRVTIYTVDGNSYQVYQSLANLVDEHHEAGLVQINRSILLNKHIARGYNRGQRRNTLQVIFKKNYAGLPAMQNHTLFVVTKEHLETFKQYF